MPEPFLTPPAGPTGLRAYDVRRSDYPLDLPTPDPTPFGRMLQWVTEAGAGQPGVSGGMPGGPPGLSMFRALPAVQRGLSRIVQALDEGMPAWRRLMKGPTTLAMRPLEDMYGYLNWTKPGEPMVAVLNQQYAEPSFKKVGASVLTHELMHPAVEQYGQQFTRSATAPSFLLNNLETLANRASQELPLAERLRIGIQMPQNTPADRQRALEELVTTWMEHKAAWKHLGVPKGEATGFAPGTLPGPQGSIFRPGVERTWVDELGRPLQP